MISAVSQTAPVEEKVTSVLEQCSELLCSRRAEDMDGFDNLSASEKAEATQLQRMIAVEQQKAQFQAQVCKRTGADCPPTDVVHCTT